MRLLFTKTLLGNSYIDGITTAAIISFHKPVKCFFSFGFPLMPHHSLPNRLLPLSDDELDRFLKSDATSYETMITKRTVCSTIPLEPLVLAACSRNIDFKFANKLLGNLLNINNIFTIIKFILANEVDMLPSNG